MFRRKVLPLCLFDLHNFVNVFHHKSKRYVTQERKVKWTFFPRFFLHFSLFMFLFLPVLHFYFINAVPFSSSSHFWTSLSFIFPTALTPKLCVHKLRCVSTPVFYIRNMQVFTKHFGHSYLWIIKIPVHVVIRQDIKQESISFWSRISEGKWVFKIPIKLTS